MAEEAFALSPISARASLPGEGDYAAIREAFMETARGRWFLSEYAKRNRNTDTGMVLDAVARIEATLASQKQVPIIGLTESLGAIRAAIREARVAAAEAMPRADDAQVAARNGARIIREIAWTLRECGADARICDLLDTQVKAIDASQRMADVDSRGAVLASFDTLVERIEHIAGGNVMRTAPHTPSSAADVAPDEVAATAGEKYAASITPLFKAAPDAASMDLAAEDTASRDAVARDAAARDAAAEQTIATIPDPIAPATSQATSTTTETAFGEPAVMSLAGDMLATIAADLAADSANEVAAADAETAARDAETAQDQAVLDIIALEMAAPDPSEPEPAGREMVVHAPAEAYPIQSLAASTAEIALLSAIKTDVPQSSLGAALIANGVIANPSAPASDPLAPIRRLSQAEKIAFFS